MLGVALRGLILAPGMTLLVYWATGWVFGLDAGRDGDHRPGCGRCLPLFLFPAAESGHHVDAAAAVAGCAAGTAKIAKRAFRKGSLAMRIRDELGDWCQTRRSAAFGMRGAPGISPAQLMMASVLQFTENLTDRQAGGGPGPDRLEVRARPGAGGSGV